MTRPLLLFVALVGSDTALAQGVAPPPLVSVAPPNWEPAPPPVNALAFAQLYMPLDALRAKSSEAVARWFDTQFDKSKVATNYARRYPGLRAAARTAALAASDRFDAEDFPRAQEDFARFLAVRFTSAEIDTLVAWRRSDTGRALMSAALANFDAYVPGAGPLTPKVQEATVDRAAAYGALSPQQQAQYEAFRASLVGSKWRALGAELQRHILDRRNIVLRQHNLVVEAAANRAMGRHIAAANRAK